MANDAYIHCQIVSETSKAVLVRRYSEAVWLPKSAITYRGEEGVRVATWFLVKSNLWGWTKLSPRVGFVT